MIPRLVVALIALLSLDVAAATDNWPGFRGPSAGVADDDPALPDTWSETENVVWKTPIPGMGWSSPVVWGDHVFLTSAISAGKEADPVKGLYDPGNEHGKTRAAAQHRWAVYDIDFKTGKVRWTQDEEPKYGTGQLLLLGDAILVQGEKGGLTLLPLPPDVGSKGVDLPALKGKTWNHPAVAHGRLFVRNGSELVCFDVVKPGA